MIKLWPIGFYSFSDSDSQWSCKYFNFKTLSYFLNLLYFKCTIKSTIQIFTPKVHWISLVIFPTSSAIGCWWFDFRENERNARGKMSLTLHGNRNLFLSHLPALPATGIFDHISQMIKGRREIFILCKTADIYWNTI